MVYGREKEKCFVKNKDQKDKKIELPDPVRSPLHEEYYVKDLRIIHQKSQLNLIEKSAKAKITRKSLKPLSIP